jgi:hypothetical protein
MWRWGKVLKLYEKLPLEVRRQYRPVEAFSRGNHEYARLCLRPLDSGPEEDLSIWVNRETGLSDDFPFGVPCQVCHVATPGEVERKQHGVLICSTCAGRPILTKR